MSKPSEQAVAGVFFALGDGTRLSLVTKLGAGTALSATVLSENAAVTRQAIVKHLQVLEGAGLVKHEKRGREVLYALEPRRLDEARAFLDGISAGWDRAIERLRCMVEAPACAGARAKVEARTDVRERSHLKARAGTRSQNDLEAPLAPRKPGKR